MDQTQQIGSVKILLLKLVKLMIADMAIHSFKIVLPHSYLEIMINLQSLIIMQLLKETSHFKNHNRYLVKEDL